MSQIDLQWFAAEDEGRTEEASEFKIRKAREEGRVAKSQELNGTIVYIFASIVLIIMAPFIIRKCQEIFRFYFSNVTDPDVADRKFYYAFLRYFFVMVFPISIVAVVAGVIANIVQNKGWLYTTKTIEPKFNKLIPKFGEYFKRTIFSLQGVFNIVKSILKVVIIAVIAVSLIVSELPVILEFLHTSGPIMAVRQLGKMVAKLMIFTGIVLLVVGVADYFVQKREFLESLKMTKQEVKEEFKEMEGDPEVKGHLEQAQREMVNQNLPKVVAASDVVITNPTHYAVALQYDREIGDVPVVAAKGEDLTAQTIKKIARENDVPVIENKPLARGLYANTEVGQFIPEEYVKAVVTVYTQVMQLDKKKKEKFLRNNNS